MGYSILEYLLAIPGRCPPPELNVIWAHDPPGATLRTHIATWVLKWMIGAPRAYPPWSRLSIMIEPART
jgi:hypothetical protein